MKETKDTVKYLGSILGAAIFMVAAYELPAETFLAFFAVVLFIIPTTLFIYMVQAMSSHKESDEQI